MSEERPDIVLTELFRMFFAVEKDVPANPLGVSVLVRIE